MTQMHEDKYMSRRSLRQLIAVTIFVICAIVFSAIFKMAIVRGSSMLPTYQDGEFVLVNKLAENYGRLKKGDVVIVHMGDDDLIKRIAFLPGDTINAEYAPAFRRVWKYFDVIRLPNSRYNNYERVKLIVPPGYIVVLGDNLAISDDSRYFGPVPIKNIIGKVVNAPPAPYHI
jgi:signal peptidase I